MLSGSGTGERGGDKPNLLPTEAAAASEATPRATAQGCGGRGGGINTGGNSIRLVMW